MKRKETERSQSIKRKSYSYKKAKEDSEPWNQLAVHQMGSEESETLFESMYLDPSKRELSCFGERLQ